MRDTILKCVLSILMLISLIILLISNDLHTSTDLHVINILSESRTEVSFLIDHYDEGDSLYFYSNSMNIEVYIDGELVDTFTNTVSASTLYTVELGEGVRTVKLKFGGVLGMLQEVNQVFVGTHSELSYHLLAKDSWLLFMNLLMLFASLVVMTLAIYFFYLKKRALIVVGYTIFFIAASLWSIVQVDFIVSLLRNNVLYYIKSYSIFALGIAAVLTSIGFNPSKKNKIYSFVFLAFFIIFPVVSLISRIFGVDLLEMLNFASILLTIIYFIGIIIMTQLTKKENRSKYSVMFVQSLIVCCIGLLLEVLGQLTHGFIGPNGMYLGICMLFVYIFSISSLVREYVKNENYRTYLSEENARLSSSILLSQIKPHFLYNALNSISFLCKRDPKQADMAVIRFSRYLRQNMKCIESSELVDFASEMEHVRNYVYLETIRFPKMEIVYELKYINFKVPPLCIQPIVENAVKHGVSKNTAGGYIIVKSFATARHIIIEVSDNGPGFDTSINMKGTGLSNISRRLKMLIEADIDFASVVGKGTVVRVKIPRKDVR